MGIIQVNTGSSLKHQTGVAETFTKQTKLGAELFHPRNG